MPMTNKHPVYLPFTSVGNSWQYTTIYDAKQDVVCRFDLEDWHVTEDNQGALEEDQTALVAFIVNAVNSHDHLLKALAEILEANKDFRAGMPEGWEGDPLQDACERAARMLASVGQQREGS
jgi:hypothetical protein